MLIIVFILMFIAFRTHQDNTQEKNQGNIIGSLLLTTQFFQYPADLIGLETSALLPMGHLTAMALIGTSG